MKSSSTLLDEPTQLLFELHNNELFLDQSTKSKIQRHLTDINDIITEEDIRNIDTSITLKAHRYIPAPQRAHFGFKK
jgi:hypothetical protein